MHAARKEKEWHVKMKVEYVQPFIISATEVVQAELGMDVTRGDLAVEHNASTTQEITVLIGVTGEIEGIVLYGTSKKMASEIVRQLTGEERPEFDELCESAVAELGNVISGRAASLFEQQNVSCTISPPTVIVGKGTVVSSVNIQRLLVPLTLPIGMLHVSVGLRETFA